jgi:hypothetical protein
MLRGNILRGFSSLGFSILEIMKKTGRSWNRDLTQMVDIMCTCIENHGGIEISNVGVFIEVVTSYWSC